MTKTSAVMKGGCKRSSQLASASQDLERIKLTMQERLDVLERKLNSNNLPLVRIGHDPQAQKVHRLMPDEVERIDHWFFIGDIHGDFYALHSLIKKAESLDPDCHILFLGDIADRGHLPLECLFLLLEWGLHHPHRLGWIAGNHDIAYRNEHDRFVSDCVPAEMVEELNRSDTTSDFRRKAGNFLISLASRLPRALLFPEGLLATHGGIPHSDLQEEAKAISNELTYFEWLNSPKCLQDFTWTRISPYPKKLPDRNSTGCQYGYKDFENFCELNATAFPVNAMVNGHEHAHEGASVNRNYAKYPVLTLLGQGFSDLADRNNPSFYIEHYRNVLKLGRGVRGAAPTVIDVEVDMTELWRVYREQLEFTEDGEPAIQAAKKIRDTINLKKDADKVLNSLNKKTDLQETYIPEEKKSVRHVESKTNESTVSIADDFTPLFKLKHKKE